jgi:hypothetical protein
VVAELGRDVGGAAVGAEPLEHLGDGGLDGVGGRSLRGLQIRHEQRDGGPFSCADHGFPPMSS